MSKIRNLALGNMGETARQQHRDQYATPLNGSSVGSGGQRFYGTGKLTVENEGLYVTGTASIAGTLTVAGTSRFSGQTFIYGPLEVTGDTILDGKTDIGGPTTVTGTLGVTGKTTLGGDTTISGKLDVTGAMSTKGTLSVEGVTTLKSNLNVTSGGKITAGNVTIDPAAASGAINFANGAQVASASTKLVLHGPGGVDVTGPFNTTNAVTMSNLPTASSTTGMKAVFVDAAGKLYKAP